ncbi:MAG: type II toxin-antitoxin system RelB/DinJ family antitoxin [Clostridiales bacterium]|jgi:addiction module RelB/DinJ family antitoxin|nr:type II toxin-antitoxin system RelB/DinJ family antitoxin [Clostridiales bacterium]
MNGTSPQKLDTIKVNAKLRAEVEYIFDEMGMTTEEAVNIFFSNVKNTGTIPFIVKARHQKQIPISEEIIDAELKEAEDDFKRTGKTFDAFAVLDELEKKYAI